MNYLEIKWMLGFLVNVEKEGKIDKRQLGRS